MSLTAFPRLLERFSDREYRNSFVSSGVRHRIALQIRAMRKRMKWSQKGLGDSAGKPQNVISRLEDPSYGKVTIQTLLDLASAFDVALVVRFASFGELAEQVESLSDTSLVVPSFSEEIEGEEISERLAASILPSQGITSTLVRQHGEGSAMRQFLDDQPAFTRGLGLIARSDPSQSTYAGYAS